MRRESVSPAPSTAARPEPERAAVRAPGPPSAARRVLALQRDAGNRAVSRALQPAPAGPVVVQRDDPKDPADLTGTVFEKFDVELKKKLADRSVFTWTHPTLAETLKEMSNANVTILARIGAMITTTAPFLWPFVRTIAGGGWITDNFGLPIGWTDAAAVEKALVARDDFCKDNPLTAKWYHSTTSAYRQIPPGPGAPSMHVVTAGRTEVHIDVHQPVEGKEKSWPWAGQCDYNLDAWSDHKKDVGGAGGARGTAVGRYGVAKGWVGQLRRSPYYEKAADESRLADADASLVAIEMVVQKYAALGSMVGSEWEGDQQMLKDAPTMGKLQKAEGLLQQVDLDQDGRKPDTPLP